MSGYKSIEETDIFDHEFVLKQASTHVTGRQSYFAESPDGHIMQVEYLPKGNRVLVHISRRKDNAEL